MKVETRETKAHACVGQICLPMPLEAMFMHYIQDGHLISVINCDSLSRRQQTSNLKSIGVIQRFVRGISVEVVRGFLAEKCQLNFTILTSTSSGFTRQSS